MERRYAGPVLVSACLLGVACRYDGRSKPSSRLLELAGSAPLVPVCPEQLGGLATPRPAAGIVGGDGLDVLEGRARVLTVAAGTDVTAAFLTGAEETLRVARLLKVRRCILKGQSPSCGLRPKAGVTAALLVSKGLEVEEL